MDKTDQKQASVDEKPILTNCIVPLLKALKWRGSRRHLKESMPHISLIYTEPMFCDVLKNLNYTCTILESRLKSLDDRLYPCLFTSKKTGPLILKSLDDHVIRAFSGKANAVITIALDSSDANIVGRCYSFRPAVESGTQAALKQSWVRQTFNNNRGLFWSSLGFSFVVNLLMLSTPIYVMNVYDRVVSTGSFQMLGEFATGIIIALIGIIVLTRIRSKIIALFGARLDREIGSRIFERLLYLSPAYTETATVGAQVARIKDFDRLRTFLSGPMLTTFFDLPYMFIALIIIGLIAGSIVIVPIVMIAIFVVFGGSLYFKVQRAIRIASYHGTRQQEFVLESISNMRAIKYLASEKEWIERYREMSAETNYASLRVSFLGAINAAMSDSLMIAAGMAVLAYGAIKIINQSLSIGAMIATMILIWRVLAPLKSIFNILPRLQQMVNSLKQINRLMRIEPEAEAIELLTRTSRKFKGNVSFVRVSLRYQRAMDPALMGVSFDVKAGEVVGVVGKNGSGKSTILKVLLGLYHPQSGSVLIDNQDIRQLNPIELRNSIAYVPQKPELFYGTITANLQLGKPDATADEMVMATRAAGIYDDIMAMPEQFDTALRDFSTSKLSASFQQGLCLARAYLKRANIMLLDEPGGVLDNVLDEYLTRVLNYCKGKVTLFMVTHRPSHMKICDKLLIIEQGQLVLFGPPAEVLPQIPKDYL